MEKVFVISKTCSNKGLFGAEVLQAYTTLSAAQKALDSITKELARRYIGNAEHRKCLIERWECGARIMFNGTNIVTYTITNTVVDGKSVLL